MPVTAKVEWNNSNFSAVIETNIEQVPKTPTKPPLPSPLKARTPAAAKTPAGAAKALLPAAGAGASVRSASPANSTRS